MIQLDGFDVLPMDSVFDTERGFGIVVEVRNADFVVRFGDRLVAFQPNGMATRRTSRTLFWHDPIVVIPAKDTTAWDNQRRAIRVFTDYVAELGCTTAQVVPD